MLKIFDNFYNKKKFNIKKENSSRSTSFLDVLLKVENNKIITNWYRKSTLSEMLLNCYSHYPESQKIAIIFNIVNKDVKLSHAKLLDENIKIIISTLLNNHYPLQFVCIYINKQLKLLKNNLKHPDNDIQKTLADNNSDIFYVSTP